MNNIYKFSSLKINVRMVCLYYPKRMLQLLRHINFETNDGSCSTLPNISFIYIVTLEKYILFSHKNILIRVTKTITEFLI